MFLAFQYPQEFPGVSVLNFLRQTVEARTSKEISILNLRKLMLAWMEKLDMDTSFADRYLNEGFSGGEKKRNEVFQMLMLEPNLALLDETDSGLDVDALKSVGDVVNRMRNDDRSFLIVTHYQRLLDHIKPDHVHVLIKGKIVQSGGYELVKRIEENGYESFE